MNKVTRKKTSARRDTRTDRAKIPVPEKSAYRRELHEKKLRSHAWLSGIGVTLKPSMDNGDNAADASDGPLIGSQRARSYVKVLSRVCVCVCQILPADVSKSVVVADRQIPRKRITSCRSAFIIARESKLPGVYTQVSLLATYISLPFSTWKHIALDYRETPSHETAVWLKLHGVRDKIPSISLRWQKRRESKNDQSREQGRPTRPG